MNKKIFEASEIPEGERVYLKKDFFGWRTIEPWKNPDGKINWFNLLTGGKKNIAILIFILLLLAGLYVGVNDLISSYKEVAKNPCRYCTDCQLQTKEVLEGISKTKYQQFNFTFNISNG